MLEPETAESSQALADITYMRGLIEQTRGRVADRYGFFFLWGAVWVAGYLATAFIPAPTGEILWIPLVALGMGGSTWLGMRIPRDQSAAPSLGASLTWMNLVLVGAFIGAPFLLGDNLGLVKSIAYIPAVVGVIYAVNGIFMASRGMILIGTWLVVAAVASLAMGATLQLVWMAVAGGGSMILTGLLLRRQLTQGGLPSSGVPSAPSPSGGIV